MPRLIDADKLKPIQVYRGDVYCKMVFMADIENAPTVDAVEVVRCEDCFWHNLCRFEQYLGGGFCSKGERKEDEE